MLVRCPNCHEKVSTHELTELSAIDCPSCGICFNLIGEETISYKDGKHENFGSFELISQIGVGAFGSVWLARDTQLDRCVAIKIPRKGQLDQVETMGFIREAQAAAQLKHPNIVVVHEVGIRDGQVFIVSDYIAGLTLDDWASGEQPTARATAELCVKLALALQHAHDAGVIHRDLKPKNIIVDQQGIPHIMDFGLAKRESVDATMTMDGKVLGTPAYMSPEQARGEAHKADCRSDIYSLGVIFYELLTDHRPFRGHLRMLLQQVINDDPPSLRKLKSAVPRDLEIICLKCLEKTPDKRYPTAKAFANDLERFLNGQTIEARPASTLERSLKWCRRKPAVASLAITLFCMMCLSLALMTGLWRLAEDERKGQYLKLYASDMNLANEAWVDNNVRFYENLLDRHSDSEHRGFEWYYLWQLGSQYRQLPQIGLDGRPRRMSLSQANNLLAVACGNRTISFGDLNTLRELPNLRVELPMAKADLTSDQLISGWERISVALSNDGRLAAYPSDDRLSVVIHNFETGEDLAIPCSESQIQAIAFSTTGNRLAVGDSLGTVRVWNLPSGAPEIELEAEELWETTLGHLSAPGIRCIDFEPSGEHFAVAGAARNIVIVDLKSHEISERMIGHKGAAWSAKYSPDGKYIASCSANGEVILWERGKPGITAQWPFDDEVRDVSFSRDSDLLAVGCRNNTATIIELDDFSVRQTLKGHAENVECVAFWEKAESLFLVTGSADKTIRLWPIQSQSNSLLEAGDSVDSIAVSPNGNWLAACLMSTNGIKVFNLRNQKSVAVPEHLREGVKAIAISDDRLLLGGPGRIAILNLKSMEVLESVLETGGSTSITAIDLSVENDFLYAGDADGFVHRWSMSQDPPARLERFKAHTGQVSCIDCPSRSSGFTLATCSYDGGIRLWRESDSEVELLPQGQESMISVDFSKDGTRLTGCGYDKIARVWTIHDGKIDGSPQEFRGHSDGVRSSSLTRDRLVTASDDGSIRIWNIETQQQLLRITGHKGAVECAVLTDDESTVISGGRDGTIRFWRSN